MRLKSAIAATAALVVSATSALALDSSMTVSSPLSPDALWMKVGDFCGMSLWNPAVENCLLSVDGKRRTLVLFGGGTAVATLDNWDNANRSYTFTNVSGLLPIANYHATVSVIENANGSALKVTATYDAKGVPDVDAKRAVDEAMYRSLCFNSPLLCSPDQRSVAPAKLVTFESVPPGPGRPLIMQGYLRRPDGTGPLPAVVLWHGCGGFAEPLDQNWAVKIASWGYVTLTIDSFGPRGIKNTCRGELPADVGLDAYRALNFLVRQRFVDPKRVVAVGFSQGGWLSLSSVERGAIEQASENKFRAAAAFYPVCSAVKGPMTVPALILTGESDHWTPAEACRKLVNGQDDWGISRKKGEGVPVRLIVYPNAYHAFDLPSLQTPITYFGHHLEFSKSVTDQSSDALHEFLQAKVGGHR